ncbi:acyltransferase family protein [Bergeyella zoohelcum]|uniref:acyltransferase family protein n=1 Tax=Bergeyella zoohelcum TaxID=1015 RepID=UPI002A918C59|nr:acyltransferase family protein [Bergeyella zoohelcum]MDY6026058.1 acyltransferase family protein [Bergeyella zoohelcum]
MKILERVTGGGRVIKYIDGLRGFSVIMVFLCHFIAHHEVNFPDFHEKYQWFYPYFGNGIGHHAVWLFFAISGFILALPFINQYVYDGKKVALKVFLLIESVG